MSVTKVQVAENIFPLLAWFNKRASKTLDIELFLLKKKQAIRRILIDLAIGLYFILSASTNNKHNYWLEFRRVY